MYGYICPDCGDHLDPGERCGCSDEEKECKGIKEEAPRYCDRCGCDLYMDSRLVTMEGEVICKDCLNDEMGGHHDI